jgi:hypothetical protein
MKKIDSDKIWCLNGSNVVHDLVNIYFQLHDESDFRENMYPSCF